jgi:hypothetical protein
MFLQEIGKEPIDGMDMFLFPSNTERVEVQLSGRSTRHTLLSTLGSVRYHQLFDVTDHRLLEEVETEPSDAIVVSATEVPNDD